MSIPGLPESREGWPPEVLEAAALFSCGDVLERPPFFYAAQPRFAVLEETKRYDDELATASDVIDAPHLAPPFGILTSQTCDIREFGYATPTKPFVSVAPVFDGTDVLPADWLSLLRKGRQIQAFLHVPLLDNYRTGVWVADLRVEFPVEKSWLVGRTPIAGFADDAAAATLGRAISEIRNRPAWADEVIEAVQSVLDTDLRRVRQEDKQLYVQLVSEIAEVGARTDSMVKPRFVQLAAFYEGGISQSSLDWWNSICDAMAEELRSRGIEAHAPTTHDLSACPVTTYKEFRPILLGKHSPR